MKPQSVVFNRHKLATTTQTPGESVDQFMQTLEKQSKHCEFTAVTAEVYRQESIRGAFITGINANTIRQRLLESDNLTLAETFRQARTLELAQKQSDTYNNPSTMHTAAAETNEHPTNQQDVQSQVPVSQPENSVSAVQDKCFYCARAKHDRSDCPARDDKCSKCNKKGHWEQACLSGRNQSNRSNSNQSNRSNSSQSNRQTSASAMAFSPSPALASTCESHNINNRDITYTKTVVKGKQVDTMVDSGSSFSFISKKTANRLKLYILPKADEISMADPTFKASIIGQVVMDITINGKLYTGLVVHVMKSLITELIIGKDFLKKHKKVTFEFGGDEDPIVFGATKKKEEITQHPSKMNVPAPPLFTNLSLECKPIAEKSRRQNPNKKKFIKEEVERLQAEGKIEPSVSPWRSQVHVTSDEDEHHRQRMVVDYSNTINIFTELDAYPMPNINEHVETVSKYKVFSTFDLKSAFHQIPIREEDKQYTAFEADGKLWQSTVVPYGAKNGVPAFQRTIDKIVEDEGLSQTFPYVDNVTVCGMNQEDHDIQVEKWLQTCKKYNITLNDKKSIMSTTSIKLLGYILENGTLRPDPERFRPLMELPAPTNLAAQRRVLGMFAYYSKWVKNFSDKVRPLNKNTTFPLPTDAEESFNILKNDIKSASLATIDSDEPFVVETDASDYALAATLNQNGRPVAFFSRTLKPGEMGQHAVEKEACAIVESLKHWNHYLAGRHFKLITDQRSVAYMYNNRRPSKIKNDKIARWRVELSCFGFDVSYRPGKENVGPDTLSRTTKPSCSVVAAFCHSIKELNQLHDDLCHPGITRLHHYIKSKNLPFSISDVKSVCEPCDTCMKEKPRFIKSEGVLIKATRPFQQLNIDFKGPLPTTQSGNRYLLTLVDEYSRFPFAFPCRDMTSRTVIKCFNQLFSLFGMPEYIHNDRAPDFLSEEVKNYLHSKGIATSRTSRYNPRGNGQIERYNGIIWQTVRLALTSKKLPLSAWESVLPDALHSIRSLLCTATNETPHERLFNYNRKSASGSSIPSWLTPGRIYIRNHARSSKHEPIVEEAELIQANPQYAFVKLKSGFETTVSLRDVAPCPRDSTEEISPIPSPDVDFAKSSQMGNTSLQVDTNNIQQDEDTNQEIPSTEAPQDRSANYVPPHRRSNRVRKEKQLFADSEHSTIK